MPDQPFFLSRRDVPFLNRFRPGQLRPKRARGVFGVRNPGPGFFRHRAPREASPGRADSSDEGGAAAHAA